MKSLNYGLIILGFVVSTATEALDFKAVCPATHTAKVNTTLKLTGKFTNNDCTRSVSINKALSAFAWNNNGSMGLKGPVVTTLNPAKIVPKASCRTITIPGCTGPYCSYKMLVSPGVLNLSMTVVSKLPATAQNTLSLVSVGYINPQTNDPVLDGCHIIVTP